MTITTDQQARQVADEFVQSQQTDFRYEYVGCVRNAKFPNEVSVNFHVRNPSGDLLEGPVVVVVDTTTAEARFFTGE